VFEEGATMRFDDAVAFAAGRRTAAVATQEAVDVVRLTRRQREIAELVAEGLTNREIAERLVITQRTAEGHVASILGRLGFTSRRQLAAWVTAQQRAPMG
jgi:non-specific serine/threonine protein kinase